MKRDIVRTVLVAMLVLGLAAVASAQGNGGCSNARVAGDWGYTKTGTLFHPVNGPTPFATMGKLTLEADGTLSPHAICSLFSVRSHGAPCRSCRWRSCCCRTGFRSISTKSLIGRARCSCR